MMKTNNRPELRTNRLSSAIIAGYGLRGRATCGTRARHYFIPPNSSSVRCCAWQKTRWPRRRRLQIPRQATPPHSPCCESDRRQEQDSIIWHGQFYGGYRPAADTPPQAAIAARYAGVAVLGARLAPCKLHGAMARLTPAIAARYAGVGGGYRVYRPRYAAARFIIIQPHQ